jgi:hypothetical protein
MIILITLFNVISLIVFYVSFVRPQTYSRGIFLAFHIICHYSFVSAVFHSRFIAVNLFSPPESYLYPSRISYKLSLKDKALSDDVKIGDIETLTDGSVFYFKDLGMVGLSSIVCHVQESVFYQHSRDTGYLISDSLSL